MDPLQVDIPLEWVHMVYSWEQNFLLVEVPNDLAILEDKVMQILKENKVQATFVLRRQRVQLLGQHDEHFALHGEMRSFYYQWILKTKMILHLLYLKRNCEYRWMEKCEVVLYLGLGHLFSVSLQL